MSLVPPMAYRKEEKKVWYTPKTIELIAFEVTHCWYMYTCIIREISYNFGYFFNNPSP